MGNELSSRFTLPDTRASHHLLEAAFDSIPLDNPRKLGDFMWIRYNLQKSPDASVLDEAIQATQNAVDHEQEQDDGAQLLFDLGVRLDARSKLTGSLDDLGKKISAFQSAVELTPDGDPNQIERLNRLGNALIERFGRVGDVDDLHAAITAFCCAVEFAPDVHSEKPVLLSNYGASLQTRFRRLGEPEDMESSIAILRRADDLVSDGHPYKPQCSNNLGNALILRFKATGELEDLEESISTRRRAVELTPNGHPDKASWFNNLGNSFLARFERTGELEDLEQAISTHRCAVELTPEGHPDKASGFNNLGNSFRSRFGRTGELEDLGQAISTHRRAVELTPDGHPDKPSRLNNLGNSFSMCFEQTRKLEDLEQATSSFRRALEMTADDHPQKPWMLRHLCQNLCTRFERGQELTDIQEAISAGDLAIELSPEEHSGLFGNYNALAECFQGRFEHSGDIDDIRKAISLFQKATELTSDGDPQLSIVLKNLGGAQRLLFERTLTQADFDVIVESLTRATVYAYASPRDRFDSARLCVLILSDYSSFSTMESLLSAHSRIIEILPEIVWLGHDIHRRYEESSQLGELVNAAVAAAITAGALTQAVEWLEAGRALIWAQVLALRTPLNELQDSHPDLAKSLRSVQQELQSSASSNFARDINAFGSVDGITVNPAADRHRSLVIEYDKLMKSIRACPGFENFLRPKKFGSLLSSLTLSSGPVVLINVHSSHCDALILCPGGAITSVALPDLSSDNGAGLLRLWLSRLIERMGRERGLVQVEQMHGYLNPFTLVLERLWLWVVCPILVALDLTAFTSGDRLPHITWCPTGWLSYLPLHAAGIYNEKLGPRVFDFVVSSYTPSLTALLRSCEGITKHWTPPELLLVTQPATPGQSALPGTAKESAGLLSVLAPSEIKAHALDDKHATVSAVRHAMSQYSWVHLACHGSQDMLEDPTQSAFLLHDGRLSLDALMGTVSENAEVAFLSACQTAVGHLKNPEESAHLAAGMLAVGFKAVIGTTWSIRDDDAPVVVESFYKELLALRSAGTLGKGETGAAYALHEATRVLRERVGENSFMRWVPFVHFGI